MFLCIKIRKGTRILRNMYLHKISSVYKSLRDILGKICHLLTRVYVIDKKKKSGVTNKHDILYTVHLNYRIKFEKNKKSLNKFKQILIRDAFFFLPLGALIISAISHIVNHASN